MGEEIDDDLIKTIDDEMGWVEEDGSSPSKTARDLGYHCKFMDGAFSSTAWCGPDGVWSVCVLSGIETTLLAKSFSALDKLYRKLRKRQNNPSIWKKYYSGLWKKRYFKWCCSGELSCDCQICRMGK